MIEKLKIGIIGLGIGQLYLEQLTKYTEYNILTIDSDLTKKAKYNECSGFRFISEKDFFEMLIICTPNHLHEEQIHQFAPISKIVLVEKPGVESSKKWEELCKKYKDTKIIMVKNNLYRDDETSLNNINYFKTFKTKDEIHLKWNNHNRIPHPGSWFTNKKMAFGGVSYDLLPHLLHFMFIISGTTDYKIKSGYKKQNYKIKDITSTDYGIINKENPIYNVDDTANLVIESGNKTFVIDTCWKYSGKDEQSISNNAESWNFGMCPNSAYENLAISLLTGDKYTKEQHFEIDINVLKIIEGLEEI